MRRLAIPLPPFLPSVNQIGFDSYDWIVGTLDITPPDATARARRCSGSSARAVAAAASPWPEPASEFAFPLLGRYRRDSLILSAEDLTLTFSFGPVPLDVFQLRGQLGRNLKMRPGANLYAETICADVPVYGPFLPLTGLCNAGGKLVSSGTFITDAYDRHGEANRRPRGLEVESVELERPTAVAAGAAKATFSLAGDARLSGLAPRRLDPAHRRRDRRAAQSRLQGAHLDDRGRQGNLTGARVEIPPGTELPASVRLYVIADVFPLAVV